MIKTRVMEAIKVGLETIPEVTKVYRIPDSPITETDMLTGPTIFFHDDGEKRFRNNRLAKGEISLSVVTYIPIPNTGPNTGASDLADIIQGKIHTVMAMNAYTGQPLIQGIEEGDVAKDYPNDEFLLLIMFFTVTYGHKWGDGTVNTY